jgi:hypothetical protein
LVGRRLFLAEQVDVKISEQKLNPSWLYRRLKESACFMVNTRAQLSNICGYLSSVVASRGNHAKETELYALCSAESHPKLSRARVLW